MDLNRLRKLAGLSEDLTPKDFERVMFGDFKDALESDTEIESHIFGAIEKFIDNASPGNKANGSKLIAQLKSVKSAYPGDLKPTVDVAYRGTQMKKETYLEIAKQYSDVKNKWISIDYVYRPRSEIQSWTTQKSIAKDFALNQNMSPGYSKYDYYGNPCPAIVRTKVDDDFILNPRLTNMIAKRIHGVPEHEIVRISPKPAQSTLLIHTSWLQGFLAGVASDE